MSETLITMYNATIDTSVNIIVPEDGRLTGVDWMVAGDTDADGEYVLAELSMLSSTSYTQHDSRGVLSHDRLQVGVAGPGYDNRFIPFNLPFEAGERIYLHVTGAAGMAPVVFVTLHFEFPSGGAPRQRRSLR